MEETCTFEQFWGVYPRKVDRKRALEVWEVMSPKNRANACAKLSTDRAAWHRDRTEMRFIPRPETYLRRIAAAPQPATMQQSPLPPVQYPSATQIAARKADLAQWRKRLA